MEVKIEAAWFSLLWDMATPWLGQGPVKQETVQDFYVHTNFAADWTGLLRNLS